MARRDLTCAIGHGKTFLGAVSVWVGGNDAQRLSVADDVLAGDAVSLALTERQHGSDVSSSEVTAVKTAQGYCLNGEKYLINNATRGQALTVFARTAHQGQSRDFTLFLVKKSQHAASKFSFVPKALTHGIRGADISGIQFQNVHLSPDAVIGKEGHGLDITLKGFQLSRSLCAALSCGAADTALRVTLEFAQKRFSGRQHLIDIPNIRQALAAASADMYVCDMATQILSRAIHVLPEQMSLLSAVLKASVPVKCEEMVESLSDVLGARSYVQVGEQSDIFGKMLRDIRLIALFDGNTAVNLQAIALQLPALARQRQTGETQVSASALEALFNLSAPLPAFSRQKLSLFTKRGDWLAAGLSQAESLSGEFPALADKAAEIRQKLEALDADVLALPNQPGHPSAIRFAQAQRYCELQLATLTLLFFIYNRQSLAESMQRYHWVEECIDRLLGNEDAVTDAICLQTVREQVAQSELLSVVRFPLRGLEEPEEKAAPFNQLWRWPMLNASSVADALRQANYQHPAFSASAILGYDRSGEFNTEAESVASRAGLGEVLASWVESPREVSLDSLTASMGELCRQDLSLGLGYCLTAFMAATNLAVAGSAAQKARVANVLRNDQRIAIAYHELHAGNDLSALALKATKVDGGYVLSGCKEVVNNLTRAKAVVLFADTGEENPARHHSLFLLTEEELSQTGVTVANRFNTLGVRNCHIMGIAFDDVFVPEHCLLGEQGRGGEYALKAFQITRTLLPAISQYALRNGLDLLTRFACQRKLYNGDLFEMPVYRKAFTEAAADTWLAGETATLMRHGLEAFPQFGNGYSAAAKFYLPRVMKKALKSMSGLLGARYYLSSDDYGLFEKLVRDFPVVSFGHAGSLVCQTTLVHQLPRLLQPSVGETAEHDLLAGNRDWLARSASPAAKAIPFLACCLC